MRTREFRVGAWSGTETQNALRQMQGCGLFVALGLESLQANTDDATEAKQRMNANAPALKAAIRVNKATTKQRHRTNHSQQVDACGTRC